MTCRFGGVPVCGNAPCTTTNTATAKMAATESARRIIGNLLRPENLGSCLGGSVAFTPGVRKRVPGGSNPARSSEADGKFGKAAQFHGGTPLHRFRPHLEVQVRQAI